MPTRYFKATDGALTFFRASPSRVYRSMISQGSDFTFSMHDRAPFPVVEITRQEYLALTALKVARVEREKAAWIAANPDKGTLHLGYWGTAPRDSWVHNEAIEAPAPAAVPASAAPPKTNPTAATYDGLGGAYDFFNERLFGGKLPRCLIVLHRHKGAFGYFHGERFGTADGEVTDEIALNPTHLLHRTAHETLSTLVHEMCHLQQHHFGKPSRASYHNREWAQMMRAVGLTPTSTGEPGGKEVGQKVTHMIDAGGRFDVACTELLGKGFALRYGERGGDAVTAAKKRASKTKYCCDSCGANAWAKPDAHLICGDCQEAMEPA